MKVAVQLILAFIVTLPLVQPVPLQPANVDPLAGVAVNVTEVPLLYDAEHVPPQLIPAGELETVPIPVPAVATAREYV